jgi:hypothetical protein
MNWTTERPKERGYYWAYEDLDPEDADVFLVYVKDELHCILYHDEWPLDSFSHWIGPLQKPEPPK